MKLHGHTRSYQEIVLALNILSKFVIEIRENSESRELLAISPYLPTRVAVSRNRLKTIPTANGLYSFTLFVTDSVDKVTYRRYNYALMISHESKQRRWLQAAHPEVHRGRSGQALQRPLRDHQARQLTHESGTFD